MGIVEIIRTANTVLKKMSHSLKTFTTKSTVCKHTRWEDRQGSTIGWVDRMKSDFCPYFISTLYWGFSPSWIDKPSEPWDLVVFFIYHQGCRFIFLKKKKAVLINLFFPFSLIHLFFPLFPSLFPSPSFDLYILLFSSFSSFFFSYNFPHSPPTFPPPTFFFPFSLPPPLR